jgi:hypothetical protein
VTDKWNGTRGTSFLDAFDTDIYYDNPSMYSKASEDTNDDVFGKKLLRRIMVTLLAILVIIEGLSMLAAQSLS